jgi:DNA transformation protein
MAAPPDFASYCAELLCAAGAVRTKRMFGGWGLYIDDIFVAIVVGEALYLKADGQTQALFAEAGSRRFEYSARGKTHPTSYWSAPPEAMDSPAMMAPWARLAVGAAVRARSAGKPKAAKQAGDRAARTGGHRT